MIFVRKLFLQLNFHSFSKYQQIQVPQIVHCFKRTQKTIFQYKWQSCRISCMPGCVFACSSMVWGQCTKRNGPFTILEQEAPLMADVTPKNTSLNGERALKSSILK